VSRKFLLIASYSDSLLNFRGSLIRSLLDKNLEVHVAAPSLLRDPVLKSKLASMNVQIHEITLKRNRISPLSDLLTIFQIWLLMLRLRPDFTLGYTIKPVIYGGIAAWLARVPSQNSLITGLGYFFVESSGKPSFLKRLVCTLYRVGLSRANKVFFQNPDDEALFFSLGILNQSDAKTCVVNGSGVDTSSFDLVPLPSRVRFLMIARLMGDKGVREYVAAAGLVRNRYPKIKFGLVGWIDESPNSISQSELQEMQETGNIEFYGRLGDVRKSIAESSVYVLPSYREGTPRTVLEAMAMGRPIITTDVPGCRETIVDGQNGFLVPVKSVDTLAAAMIQFIESPELITKMGNQSRQIVVEKYDVHKVNAIMLTEMGIA